MELFRQLLEKWHAAEYAHPSQNPYSVHKPVYQASLLSITESLVIPTSMPLSGISTFHKWIIGSFGWELALVDYRYRWAGTLKKTQNTCKF